jgi:RNAse (barnase) inhibitor barstar
MTRATGITRAGQPAAAIAKDARLRGASVGVVAPADKRTAVLTEIGRALRFPGYYGRNLDALEECLTDLSWLPEGEVVLVWDGDMLLQRADPASHASVLEVLTSAAAAMRTSTHPLHVVLADAGPNPL